MNLKPYSKLRGIFISKRDEIELLGKIALKKKEKEAEVEERKVHAWSKFAIIIGAILIVLAFVVGLFVRGGV